MSSFTVANLKASPDFNKLIVADWDLARKLEGETWTQHGTYTSVYYTTFADGEITKLYINGTECREKSSLASVGANSFYFDLSGKTLYVQTTDGDSPATLSGSDFKYCVVAYFPLGLSNRPATLKRFRDMVYDGGIELWNSSSDPYAWIDAITGTAAVAREASDVYGSDSAYSAKLTVSAAASSAQISNFSAPGPGGAPSMMVILPSKLCMIRFKYKTGAGTALKLLFRDMLGVTCWLKEDGTWSASEYKIAIPASTVWTEYSLTFNSYSAADQWYRIVLRCETNGDVAYIDNVEVKRFYEEAPFDPRLPAGFPSIRQSIGSFRDPGDELSLGALNIEDDGFFAYNFPRILWDNRAISILIGTPTSTYIELAKIFSGITRSPALRDGSFSVDVSDARAEFKSLLPSTFDATNYPNCEDQWKLKPIPILFGAVTKFQPPQSNVSSRIYTLSQTVFNSVTYALTSVDAVYINGVAQTEGVGYSKSLSAGTVTILTGSSTDTIEVSATGYWTNFVDFIFFVLFIIQGLSIDQINLKSFNDLKAKRVLSFAKWYSDQISIRDFLATWKLAAQFFFFLRSDGVYFARVLTQEGSPTYERPFFNEDFSDPEASSLTDQAYASVSLKYRSPALIDTEKTAPTVASRPTWEREIRSDLPLSVDPYIADADATLLSGKYGAIFQTPPEAFKVKLPAHALFIEPTDLIYLWKTVKAIDGTIKTLYSGTAFFVFEVEKDVAGGSARIVAYKALPAYSWSETS